MTKREISLKIDDLDARLFKARCAMYGEQMSGILRPAIQEYLRTHPPIQPKQHQID